MKIVFKEALLQKIKPLVKPGLGVCFAIGAFFFFLLACAGNPAAVFILVPLSFILAMFAGALLFPSFGGKFANNLCMPRSFLKAEPIQLSPISGLIGNRRYNEAIEKLNIILEKKPFCPNANLMLMEIYIDQLEQPEKATEIIEKYFRRSRIKPFHENIELMLRYSDLCEATGQTMQALILLKHEAKRKGYAAHEKRMLSNRIDILEGNIN
ncbi:MAG: hypothetical protein GY750_14960 [Lentisphaerae bacterium]|nr:hypothetical protein [Lentisphaerota bacterium]MCP4102700.1 hypothetical protein [Lentisphaerota bacterium]